MSASALLMASMSSAETVMILSMLNELRSLTLETLKNMSKFWFDEIWFVGLNFLRPSVMVWGNINLVWLKASPTE